MSFELDLITQRSGEPVPQAGHTLAESRAEDILERAGLAREQALALAAERGGHPDHPDKDDPLDAAIWQRSIGDEPAWDSPWGRGRPGWHAECTAMAIATYGPSLDLHAGGADLAFPQVTGKRPAKVRLVNAYMPRPAGHRPRRQLSARCNQRGDRQQATQPHCPAPTTNSKHSLTSPTLCGNACLLA